MIYTKEIYWEDVDVINLIQEMFQWQALINNTKYILIHKFLQFQQMQISTMMFSLLITSYMFRLNCHHHGANIYITKIYCNKIVLQCLWIKNI
jgi:hypothetical protein